MVGLSPSFSSPSPSPFRLGGQRSSAGSPQDLVSRIKARSAAPSMHTASEVSVQQSRSVHRAVASSAGATAPDRVVAFLKARHPSKTAEHVSAETGISRETINSWIVRGSAPSLPAMLNLIGTYGPDFLAAAMHSPPSWLSAAAREAKRRALEETIARHQAELETLRSGL